MTRFVRKLDIGLRNLGCGARKNPANFNPLWGFPNSFQTTIRKLGCLNEADENMTVMAWIISITFLIAAAMSRSDTFLLPRLAVSVVRTLVCKARRSALSRMVLGNFGLGLALALSSVGPVQAATLSAACQAVNSGTPDFSGGASAPAGMSGTYTSRDNFGWDMNVLGSASNLFNVGEIISYSYAAVGTSPYIQIQLTNSGGTPYSSSALNRTGSGSGSFEIVATDDQINISAMPIRLDSSGNTEGNEDPAKHGAQANITLSCAAPASTVTPAITSLSPEEGTTAGGTIVTITGTDFSTTLADNIVKFGSDNATVTAATATQLTVESPAHAAGQVNVSVTVGGETATKNNAYKYVIPAPTISNIAPNTGSTDGNSSVTITGTNLIGATSVTFGGAAGTGLTVNSGSSITVTTPAHAAGAVDVVVTAAGGPVTSTGGFTYVAPPAISSATPNTGSTDGGEPLTLTGVGFTGATSATIGGHTVTDFIVVNDTTITLTTPATTAGTHDVVVAAVSGSLTLPNSFTSSETLPAAIVWGISPDTGLTSGNTTVTLSGMGFDNVNGVKFGGVAATSFMIINDGEITAVTPAHAAGLVTVEVTLPNGGKGELTDSFTFVNADLSGLSLSSGTLNPTFASGTTGYTASVTNAVSSITVTPTVSDSNATVTVNGQPATTPVNLNVGSNTVTIVVTAQDGSTTKIYTVTVTRAPAASTDADLSGLSLSSGTLDPAFASGTTGYTAAVANAVSSITVTPTVSDINATVTVNGQPAATPVSLNVGSNTVTVVVTAQDGSTTKTYTVTVTRAAAAVAVTLSPAAGSLPAATVGASYNEEVTASGGTAPYTYSVVPSDLPAGLSLNSSTGAITGTPSTAGNKSFTINVSDSATPPNTASAVYTITVNSASSGTFVFTPSAGTLPEAMAGEAYSQIIRATGGSGVLSYTVIGTLPSGLTLSPAGELSGTLADNAEGEYTFDIKVTDTNSAADTANYTLRVKQRSVTVASQTIVVPAGSSPPDARLDRNATGGPFDNANLVSVQPANAGTATITMGDYAQVGPVSPVGWYLKFTPASGYSGTVVITFNLTSGIGSSTGTVTYTLGYDPAEVVTDIHNMVHGFVQTRQSMISSAINVPGLLERRRMEHATDPVTARMMPSQRGMTLGFSTSLAQLEATSNGAAADATAFNIWVDGKFFLHNRGQNDSRWGSFGMVSVGADYLLSDKALVGLSFHYDRMTDPTSEDAELTGNGWLAGPYASFEIGKGVFWDTSVLYGGSANDIDTAFWDGAFDTTRWMVDTAIKGQWDIDNVTTLTPKLRAVYFSEKVETYTVANDRGDELTIAGFSAEQFRVSLGAEIAREFTLENNAVLTPKLGVTGGFSGLDGSGAFGTLTAGLTLETEDMWNLDFSLLFNIEGEGEKSAGARAGVSKRF